MRRHTIYVFLPLKYAWCFQVDRFLPPWERRGLVAVGNRGGEERKGEREREAVNYCGNSIGIHEIPFVIRAYLAICMTSYVFE